MLCVIRGELYLWQHLTIAHELHGKTTIITVAGLRENVKYTGLINV